MPGREKLKRAQTLRYCIVNGDDFGATRGINQGILDTHRRGILTSTSLMVDGPYAGEAAAMSRKAPALSVGLHVVLTNEQGEPLVDLQDPDVCRRELDRQFEKFHQLIGALPTHVDSHHHVHRQELLLDLFLEFTEPHELPLRHFSSARYVGSFYGQEGWGETRKTRPDWIDVEHLSRLLEELPEGVTEIGCHPGYVDSDLDSVYSAEREVELVTLCDPGLSDEIRRLGIHLIAFAELGTAAGQTRWIQ